MQRWRQFYCHLPEDLYQQIEIVFQQANAARSKRRVSRADIAREMIRRGLAALSDEPINGEWSPTSSPSDSRAGPTHRTFSAAPPGRYRHQEPELWDSGVRQGYGPRRRTA